MGRISGYSQPLIYLFGNWGIPLGSRNAQAQRRGSNWNMERTKQLEPMTFPAYRRITSPDGPLFDSFHKIEKFEQPPCYIITQVSMVKPLSGYITKSIEIGSRIHKLIEGSEKTTRKQFGQKMKDVFNHLK